MDNLKRKKNSIYGNIKRNKLGINQRDETPVHWKLQKKKKNHWMKINNSSINGNISHLNGLEKLVVLRCPFYPKQSIDSVPSLSISQIIFLQK